ncbi:MAG: DUF488 domain-containing protein [Gemmatimonadetes bacterium]|nr:DUF488 domain-containing protein [Gemmatimonadota bacterium]
MALLYTIGHSTHTLEEFLALLRQHAIKVLVDVRRFPTSRRHPHFVREALAEALRGAGVEYVHEPQLGGWRSARPDSPNTAWRTKGFQGYADHMGTPEFGTALARIVALGSERATAVMCAEITPWRCHRQLRPTDLPVGPGETHRVGRVAITPDVHAAFLRAVHIAFALFAVLCVAGVFVSLARGPGFGRAPSP